MQKLARSMQAGKRAVWPCPSASAAAAGGGPDLGKVAQEAAPEAAGWYQQQLLWCSRGVQQHGLQEVQEQPGQARLLGSISGGHELVFFQQPAGKPAALAMLVLQNATQYNGGLKAMLAKNSKTGNNKKTR